MTEKPDPRARLVAETFNDDWNSGPASALARHAAAHARRRRAMGRAVAAGGALAVVFTAFLVSARLRVPPTGPGPSNAMPAAAVSPAFEIISDEELMAALRNRPLLVLPQETGARKFVLLDR